MLASQISADAIGMGTPTAKAGRREHGSGGLDFVGRLDVGAPGISTPLVVLGRAKCIRPDSSVGPDQIASGVARLRRSWVGVYVTTGWFTPHAQAELVVDEYPIIPIPGVDLASEACTGPGRTDVER
jgi:hypothetical protein